MKRFAAPLIAAVLLLFPASQLRAHGGGDLIAGPVTVGGYSVSIWLNPPDPRATEEIHFTVGVAAPDDKQPVLDAHIMVEMRDAADGSLAASAPATTAQSVNKLFYETDLEVDEAGLYETIFYVRGVEGEGSLAVDINVGEPSRVNWFAVGLVGMAFIVIAGWWRSRKSERMPAQER